MVIYKMIGLFTLKKKKRGNKSPPSIRELNLKLIVLLSTAFLYAFLRSFPLSNLCTLIL